MIVLTGLDLTSVTDVNDVASNPDTRDQIWTAREQCAHEGYPDRRAGQWAAKEAIMKALGQGVGQLAAIDIEIINDEGRPPRAVLHGSALTRSRDLGVACLSISITHEHGAAAAIAVGLVLERSDDD